MFEEKALIDNTHIKNMEWDISSGRIVLREGNKHYENVLYWYFKYKFLKYSIYYDPDDSLGIVGVPYFEVYANEDTFRFSVESKEEMFAHLRDATTKHDIEVQEHPEYFL